MGWCHYGGWEVHDLKLASWRAREVPVQRQEKTDAPAQRQPGREKKPSSLSHLVYAHFQQTAWGPPTWGGDICLPQSAWTQVFISSRNTLTDIPQIIFNQMSGHPMAQSSLHIKFTTTVSPWKSFALLLCLLMWTYFCASKQWKHVSHSIENIGRRKLGYFPFAFD